jgi:hypothetical protein
MRGVKARCSSNSSRFLEAVEELAEHAVEQVALGAGVPVSLRR